MTQFLFRSIAQGLAVMALLVGVLALPTSSWAITPSITPTATSSAQIASDSAKGSEYILPYPGLLPDHPLYFIKATRDGIMMFLIGDPIKKTEFALLQADKRVNAAIFLYQKGNTALAQSTLDKAEKYREQAISYLRLAQKEGRDSQELRSKINRSFTKQEEVLQQQMTDVDSSLKNEYQKTLDKLHSDRANFAS